MIKEMKKRKVKNHEFMGMYIMSYTKRLSDIRKMGFTINKERVYGADGKATGTFVYWIPRKLQNNRDGMEYESIDEQPKSNFLIQRIKFL
jgi:hypothetical protein